MSGSTIQYQLRRAADEIPYAEFRAAVDACPYLESEDRDAPRLNPFNGEFSVARYPYLASFAGSAETAVSFDDGAVTLARPPGDMVDICTDLAARLGAQLFEVTFDGQGCFIRPMSIRQ